MLYRCQLYKFSLKSVIRSPGWILFILIKANKIVKKVIEINSLFWMLRFLSKSKFLVKMNPNFLSASVCLPLWIFLWSSSSGFNALWCSSWKKSYFVISLIMQVLKQPLVGNPYWKNVINELSELKFKLSMVH